MIGDVFGAPGMRAVEQVLPRLREEHAPNIVVVNAENAAAGSGTTPKLAKAHTEIKPAHERYTPAVSLPQLTLEIVVVSSDRDEAAFASYHKEMPCPASSPSRGALLPL